jgi:hypothetical protein
MPPVSSFGVRQTADQLPVATELWTMAREYQEKVAQRCLTFATRRLWSYELASQQLSLFDFDLAPAQPFAK